MPVEKKCVICSSIFYVKPSHVHDRFCCSRNCQAKNQKNKTGELNSNWRGDVKIKICEYCGKEYRPHFTGRKYCSVKCAQKSKINVKRNLSEEIINSIRLAIKRRDANKTRKKYFCECGNEVKRKTKKCNECISKTTTHLNKKCAHCQKDFRARYSAQKFCSKDCFKIYKQTENLAEKNSNWKGGVKSENQVGRHTVKYNEWMTEVFIRDKYTCQHCGQIGGKLNSHHILRWSAHKDKRFDVSNGLTLCVDCHRKEHNWKLKKLKQ
jgi:gas vesicle protein